jgi:hypothetical protein
MEQYASLGETSARATRAEHDAKRGQALLARRAGRARPDSATHQQRPIGRRAGASNVQTVVAQLIAVVAVIGSYAVSHYQAVSLPKKAGVAPFAARQAPPLVNTTGTRVPTATGAGA